MRAFTILLFVVSCGAAPPARTDAQRATDDAPALAALRDSQFDLARSHATAALALDPRNSQAAAIRALATYITAGSELWQRVEELTKTADIMKAFDHAEGRAMWSRFAGSLADVERDLAVAAEDPRFSLELCLACWQRDWNHTGEIDDRDRHLLEVEIDGSGAELPDGDPRRRPTFHFDIGDISWARSMVAFQRAAVELVLAYRWTELDKLFGGASGELRISVEEPERVKLARAFVLDGVGYAERCRREYLAETDDDREWVPNPRQHSHPIPLDVDDALYQRWGDALEDVRHLVAGDQGLSLRELGALIDPELGREMPDAYVDVGRMLSEPTDIVVAADKTGNETQEIERFLRGMLGNGYRDRMEASPLVGRLARAKGELDHGSDTVDRKLRYLFWLN